MTIGDKELWLKKHGKLSVATNGVSIWTTRHYKATTVSFNSNFNAIINDLYDEAVDDLFKRCCYYEALL